MFFGLVVGHFGLPFTWMSRWVDRIKGDRISGVSSPQGIPLLISKWLVNGLFHLLIDGVVPWGYNPFKTNH